MNLLLGQSELPLGHDLSPGPQVKMPWCRSSGERRGQYITSLAHTYPSLYCIFLTVWKCFVLSPLYVPIQWQSVSSGFNPSRVRCTRVEQHAAIQEPRKQLGNRCLAQGLHAILACQGVESATFQPQIDSPINVLKLPNRLNWYEVVQYELNCAIVGKLPTWQIPNSIKPTLRPTWHIINSHLVLNRK